MTTQGHFFPPVTNNSEYVFSALKKVSEYD